MKFLIIFFISLLAFAGNFPKIPNVSTSPGHLCSAKDKDFVENRYQEKVPYCKRNVSLHTKNYIYSLYNIPSNERKDFTIDHIIPLAIGGSNNIKNLWPEHFSVKNTRKNLEYNLFINLKKGSISQKEAIETVLNVKFNTVPEN